MLRSDLLREAVPLSGLTTLEIGGPARFLACPETPSELCEVLARADRLGLPVYPLGEGSNLVASDEGFEGMLVQSADRSLRFEASVDGEVRVRAGAGVSWDDLVARAVEEGLAGLECLSGIPGRVGASPIQNVGAYGQEVAEPLRRVEVLDLRSGQVLALPREACGFGYRTSHFKVAWRGRYLVTAVEFGLSPGGQATLRYGDLTRYFGMGPGDPPPPLAEVRRAVLEVRRSKSMTRDPEDPNRRSAGSFFTNPVVPEAQALRLLALEPGIPAHPAGPGQRKLSAAWLIEHAGFPKGHVRGRVGLSTNHVLALVNLGGATARELLALAGEIRRGVSARFGVALEPEPNLLGFREPLEDLLGAS